MDDGMTDDICEACRGSNDNDCQGGRILRLSNFKPGDRGTIAKICGNPDFRLRMMEMGFTRGAEVKVVKYAPLSDPIELLIKGYHITLRKEQAKDILMMEPEKAA